MAWEGLPFLVWGGSRGCLRGSDKIIFLGLGRIAWRILAWGKDCFFDWGEFRGLFHGLGEFARLIPRSGEDCFFGLGEFAHLVSVWCRRSGKIVFAVRVRLLACFDSLGEIFFGKCDS